MNERQNQNMIFDQKQYCFFFFFFKLHLKKYIFNNINILFVLETNQKKFM